MQDILVWLLKLVLAILLITPVVGGVGYVLIDKWWQYKKEFEAARAKAQADAMLAMAGKIREGQKAQ